MTAPTATVHEIAHATDVRRRLHRIPELAYEEFETAGVIREELRRLGIAYVEGPETAPTATVAVIGDPSKPCVALRADIDALPITEATGVEYASTRPGRMHACGHDGHAANLLCTAAVLKRAAGELGGPAASGGLPVCVKLIFQPAEEGGGGAGRLVEAGVLEAGRYGPRVSAVFGLHGYPGLPVGVVSTRPGPLMASTDTLRVTVRGSGCHGAFPHLGRDPIVAAAECVTSLQGFVSREMDPTDAAVVTVGKFHAGTATNVIPDTAVFEGTVRTLTDATRAKARAAILRRVSGIASAHGCSAEIDYEEGYPATINDAASAELVAKVAREELGAGGYVPCGAPVMGGEDFAYYLRKVPGAFFFVGVRPEGRETYPPLHSDRFDFNDSVIGTTTRMFVAIVRAWAKGT